MHDSNQDCVGDLPPEWPWSGPERRLHPRRATDTAEGWSAASPLTLRAPDPSLLARLLSRWGMPVPAFISNARPSRTAYESRRERLPKIVRKLEIALAALDDIGAWREAADVCSALERLKAEIAEGHGKNKRKRWTF